MNEQVRPTNHLQNEVVLDEFLEKALGQIETYDFVSAVRLLRQYVYSSLGEVVADERASPYARAFGPIRFRSTLRLAHPSSVLSHVELREVGPSDMLQPVLWVQFVGMAGLQGPLALTFSERILNNLKQKDQAAASFLDIFNHRLALLFYDSQKWVPGSAVCPPERSSLGQLILSLGGLEGDEDHPAKCPDLQRYILTFKTLFWQRIRSRSGLELILSFFLKARVQVREGRGEVKRLPEREMTRVGAKKGQRLTLGRDAFLGQHVWSMNSDISLFVTPETHEHYGQFNPYNDSPFYRHLRQLLRAYLPQNLRVRVFVKLPCDEGEVLTLGQSHHLGFDTWLGSASVAQTLPLRRLGGVTSVPTDPGGLVL